MISHESKSIFIHLPRTGGSTMETLLCGRDWSHIDWATKHIHWKKAKSLYSEYWDSYFKFSIVRNPVEWVRSLYRSPDRSCGKTFEEFCLDPSFDLRIHETKKFTLEDFPVISLEEMIGSEVNCIYRFEDLISNGYRHVFNDLKILYPLTVPRIQSFSQEKPDHTARSLENVRTRFKDIIEEFYPEMNSLK